MLVCSLCVAPPESSAKRRIYDKVSGGRYDKVSGGRYDKVSGGRYDNGRLSAAT